MVRHFKPTFLILLVAILASLVVPFALPIPVLAANITFNSTSPDFFFNYISGYNANSTIAWDEAHDDTTQTLTTGTTNIRVQIARGESGGDYRYTITRCGIYFDTSSLPDDANITSAVLRLYYTGTFADDFGAWELQVQSGMPTYPHEPPVVGDYYYNHYSGSGGVLNSSDMDGSLSYRNITLNATGIGWINTTGITKFMLRDNVYDIPDSEPTGTAVEGNRFDFYTYEQGAGYWPQLVVTYGATDKPTITTNDATQIGTTTARLNSHLNADGGEACDVRFQYGNSTGNYTTNTTWVNDTYTTGDYPYADITGLTLNTTYYFRVQATNSEGMANGTELNFTTLLTLNPPTNLTAYPSSHNVSLIWAKGVGSTNTRVQFKIGSYPTNYTDGEQIYFGTMSTVTHSNLTPGTSYYYRAWGESGGNYSTTNASIMTTTYAGAIPDVMPATPPVPSGWWGIPDYTVLENVAGYGILNDYAETYDIPLDTFWFILILMLIMGAGLFIYSKSHNATVAILIVGALIVIASFAELLPLWLLVAFGVPAISIMLVQRRV